MAITDKRRWAFASARFRERRNQALGQIIASLDSPRILDVGGHPAFWPTVPHARRAQEIVIVNSGVGEHSSLEEMQRYPRMDNTTLEVGDACDLRFRAQEFDLVVCNSVLEHVSGWANVERAARELRRVGRHGWVQTPAYEFPLEVHYMRPFVHWVAEPTRAAVLRVSVKRFRDFTPAQFREMFLFVQLLSEREMRQAFPGAEIRAERFLGLRKSHIAVW